MGLNFSSLLEVLFPLSSDERTLVPYTPESFAQALAPSFVHGTCALARFNNAPVRAAVHLAKFHNNRQAQKLLSALLAQWITAAQHTHAMVVPVPLSTGRMHERGHNQVETIARLTVQQFPNIELCTDVLVRNRHTPPQTSLCKADREHNLVGAFSVCPESIASIAHKHIILLDDVVTTGATLLEARTALMEAAPASVIRVALAH